MRKLRESLLRILVRIEKRERSKISRSHGRGSEPKGGIENLFLRPLIEGIISPPIFLWLR